LNAAATYIEEQWRGMGASVDEQPYAVGSRTFKNLLVTLGQKDGDRIVVGAHYDVCGERPGADDNASGIAGLIELTRLLQLDGARLHHRVDLVAYSTEEPPYFATSAMGSAHHARLIKDQGVKISAMLSLEMLGFFSNEPGSQGFPLPLFSLFYPTKGNYIAVVGRVTDWALTRQMKSLMQSATALPVYSANSPRFIPGIDWSDQRGYWDLGYPAVMVTDTAFLRNPNYHETTDTIDTLDFDRMADVVTAVHAAVKDLR
jgi:Zn-dependent M28 family amino/carboxypeptidase